MNRFLAMILICSPLAALAGCAMCCAPFDYAYPTYGGKWQRTDREHGRVGSLFTPQAGVKVEEGDSVVTDQMEGEIIEGEVIEQGVIEGNVAVPEVIERTNEASRLVVPVQ